MAFHSPVLNPARVDQEPTDFAPNRCGTAFRFRKSFAFGRSNHEMESEDSLTFLSPKPTRRNIIAGSSRISGFPKHVSVMGNLEISNQLTKTETFIPPSPKSPSFDLCSPIMSCDINNNSVIVSKHTNSQMSLLSFEKRGTKRKCANDDLEEDVVDDIMMSKNHFPRSNAKRKKGRKLVIHPQYSFQELERIYVMIDRYQEEMYKLQAKDWDYKRKYWVEQCNKTLWKVLKSPALLESSSSEMFPKTLIFINKLTSKDKHWLRVLVNSARVESIKCPEFTELIRDPRVAKTKEDVFEFRIEFQFGFDVMDIAWFVHSAIGSIGINHYICDVVAEYVGNSKFLCDIQIYYKKSVTPWWQQDGIAKMKYWSGGEYIDMIEFSPEEAVYFIRDLADIRLVIDDYNDVHLPDFEQLEEESSHFTMDRKFITAVCCQLIHVCINKTPSPQSCAARNVLKQLEMILKGWFIGVFLGEGICPDNLVFEYDTRAPCPDGNGGDDGTQGP